MAVSNSHYAVPFGVEDVQEYAAGKVGVAIVNLNRIEACIDDVLEEIKTGHQKIKDSITAMVYAAEGNT